jgi:molybdopterin-guanine dinucleotide biosynthesis protein A
MEAAGFVLGGGRSSRMGSEKALALFAGQPLLLHALRILKEAGLSPAIAGARAPLERFAPVVTDTFPDRGPLAGICAALQATTAPLALFLPVDMPLLPPALLRFLLAVAAKEASMVTVASVNGFVQTFPAVVSRSALPGLQCELAAASSGCLHALRTVAERMGETMTVVPMEAALRGGKLAVASALPLEAWFLNVNSQEDLARAEACLAKRLP